MLVWRICRQAYAAEALHGIGGLYVPGRWHRRGQLIVYTSGSAALAAMEVLVHTDPLTAPADLRLLTIEVPDEIDVELLDPAALPAGWNGYPAPEELRRIGGAWLESQRSLALKVPSAVISRDWNLLFNPHHPEHPRISVVEEEPFRFDPRLI
jgi:RES domain-containing protein